MTVMLAGATACGVGKSGRQTAMKTWQAIVLGITEGVTEYLPVSSTGHLYLAGRVIGLGETRAEQDAVNAYSICIQFGAIIAVLLLYSNRIRKILLGLIGRDRDGLRLAINLAVAFVPAAGIGFALEDKIKAVLFGLWPITAAWFAGGIVILLMSRRRKSPGEGRSLEALTPAQAALAGAVQCLAMWPGVSRSLAVIIGGLAVGLSATAAVEFSFLLGLVTLGAATSYETLKEGGRIVAMFGIVNPLIGLGVAFVSAIVAVKWMVSYLNRNGLAIFGWYRIVLSIVVAALIAAGVVN